MYFDMLNRLGVTHECVKTERERERERDRQTERQRDRRTDITVAKTALHYVARPSKIISLT